MLLVVALLVALVQTIQFAGNRLRDLIDRRG
jgi:ABC-type methionine transport system permease subunit